MSRNMQGIKKWNLKKYSKCVRYVHCSKTFVRHLSSKKTNSSSYCMEAVRKYDHENFLCTLLLPKEARASAFALRAYNIELSQVRDVVSDKNIGILRLQFWKDTIEEIYEDLPKASPIAVALSHAVKKHQLSRKWLLQMVEAREDNIEERPFTNMEEVDAYADKTTRALNYLILESLGVKNLNADHVASHLGKAQGISILLRGIIYNANRNRVLLPMDVMIKHNVSQQEVLRGSREQKMKDVIYDLASEAHLHIEAARAMKKDVPREAVPAFLPSVCCESYLKNIQKLDFDVFNGLLQNRNNWLPMLLMLKKLKRTY